MHGVFRRLGQENCLTVTQDNIQLQASNELDNTDNMKSKSYPAILDEWSHETGTKVTGITQG